MKNPVKKCVKDGFFSHTFHMFFTAFHMHISHACKILYSEIVCESGEMISTLSYTFSPAFYTSFHMNCYTNLTYYFTLVSLTCILHEVAHKIAIKMHILLHTPLFEFYMRFHT